MRGFEGNLVSCQAESCIPIIAPQRLGCGCGCASQPQEGGAKPPNSAPQCTCTMTAVRFQLGRLRLVSPPDDAKCRATARWHCKRFRMLSLNARSSDTYEYLLLDL